jgi:hypothetical protein
MFGYKCVDGFTEEGVYLAVLATLINDDHICDDIVSTDYWNNINCDWNRCRDTSLFTFTTSNHESANGESLARDGMKILMKYLQTEQLDKQKVDNAIERLRMNWLPTSSREAAQEMSNSISRCKGTNIWDYTLKFDCLNDCTPEKIRCTCARYFNKNQLCIATSVPGTISELQTGTALPEPQCEVNPMRLRSTPSRCYSQANYTPNKRRLYSNVAKPICTHKYQCSEAEALMLQHGLVPHRGKGTRCIKPYAGGIVITWDNCDQNFQPNLEFLPLKKVRQRSILAARQLVLNANDSAKRRLKQLLFEKGEDGYADRLKKLANNIEKTPVLQTLPCTVSYVGPKECDCVQRTKMQPIKDARVFPQTRERNKQHVELVAMPGATPHTSSTCVVGFRIRETMEPADTAALELAVAILGDGFAGRLMTKLRTEMRISYGAYGAERSQGSDTLIYGMATFDGENTEKGTQAMLSVVNQWKSGMEPISEERVEIFKERVASEHIIFSENPGTIAEELVLKDPIYLQQRHTLIEQTTAEQINQVLMKFVKPISTTCVVAGYVDEVVLQI